MASKTYKKTRSDAAQSAELSTHVDLFGKLKICIDERIRPFIQMDGGDIEILELVDGPLDGKGKPLHKVLRVQLQGACVGCSAATYTLQFGVQNAINEEFPDEDILIEQVGD